MRTRTLVTLFSVAALLPATARADAIGPKQVKFADMKVEASLTGRPGDPDAGAKVFKTKKLGNCVACHRNDQMPKVPFQGNIGPALGGVGSRYPKPILRAIVVNAKKVFGPQTVMPGFYTLDVGRQVPKKLEGKTILTARQVEDVVAYLATLKE